MTLVTNIFFLAIDKQISFEASRSSTQIMERYTLLNRQLASIQLVANIVFLASRIARGD